MGMAANFSIGVSVLGDVRENIALYHGYPPSAGVMAKYHGGRVGSFDHRYLFGEDTGGSSEQLCGRVVLRT